jgi:hypothetical protein
VGQGVWESADSGVCLDAAAGFVDVVLDSSSGDERRTLSAKESASALVSLLVGVGDGAGAADFGIAKGLAPPAAGAPKLEEKGFAFAETLPVRDVAPNRLAPRSCFGFSGAGVGSGAFSTGFFFSSCLWAWGFSRLILRVERYARMLPGLRLHGFLGHPKRYSRRSSLGK